MRPDRPIEYVILDQDAGRTLGALLNINQANRSVFVSKLDAQSCSGLVELVKFELDHPKHEGQPTQMHVVLSQYDGRSHAVSPRWQITSPPHASSGHYEESTFFAADLPRRDAVSRLEQLGIDSTRQMYVVDFHREALQREFFFPEKSPPYNELVRLAVALTTPTREESGSITKVAEKRKVRILGEYVEGSQGSLEAFAKWAQRYCDVEVVGARHEDIVELVEHGSRAKDHLWQGYFMDSSLHFDKGTVRLSDFDLVAVPAYARHLNDRAFAPLEGPRPEMAPRAQDCAGPITEAYLLASILGWLEYARRDERLLGYPLFVDCLLLAVNPRTVNYKFFQEFRRQEERSFRGLDDPADFRDLTRAAAKNNQSHDRLVMTLKSGAVAAWYEWLTIVAMFGCDHAAPSDEKAHSPMAIFGARGNRPVAERIRAFLEHPMLVHATIRYLELVLYADRQSKGAEWPETLAMIHRGEVGMALVWPDARPQGVAASTDGSPVSDSGSGRATDDDRRESVEPSARSHLKLRYAVPPGGLVTEGWLLCVPANRGDQRPPVAELEQLLQRFMTYDEQQSFAREHGGLPVHRGVMDDVSLWRDAMHLPLLSGIFAHGTDRSRLSYGPADRWVRLLSQRLLRELEELRWDVAQLVKSWDVTRLVKEELHTQGEDLGLLAEPLWHSAPFVAQVKTLVEEKFKICAQQFAQEQESESPS